MVRKKDGKGKNWKVFPDSKPTLRMTHLFYLELQFMDCSYWHNICCLWCVWCQDLPSSTLLAVACIKTFLDQKKKELDSLLLFRPYGCLVYPQSVVLALHTSQIIQATVWELDGFLVWKVQKSKEITRGSKQTDQLPQVAWYQKFEAGFSRR